MNPLKEQILLRNQEKLTAALFRAELYITSLEKELKDKPRQATGKIANDYYSAMDVLYRSEDHISPVTSKFPRPSFKPWVDSTLDGIIKDLEAWS